MTPKQSEIEALMMAVVSGAYIGVIDQVANRSQGPAVDRDYHAEVLADVAKIILDMPRLLSVAKKCVDFSYHHPEKVESLLDAIKNGRIGKLELAVLSAFGARLGVAFVNKDDAINHKETVLAVSAETVEDAHRAIPAVERTIESVAVRALIKAAVSVP